MKKNMIFSPDSSGILLWRVSPQEIQRMAGELVRKKIKRVLRKINNFNIRHVLLIKKNLILLQ
jgi:hypothetical protein